MSFPSEQIEELKTLFGEVQKGEEGGKTYLLIPNLAMPEGCEPKHVEALLCPSERDGYPSRLFFARHVSSPTKSPNWNGSARILERQWFAYSWRVPQTDLRLAQLVLAHLRGLR